MSISMTSSTGQNEGLKATLSFETEKGLVTASWNCWVDAHSGEGVASSDRCAGDIISSVIWMILLITSAKTLMSSFVSVNSCLSTPAYASGNRTRKKRISNKPEGQGSTGYARG